CTSRVLVSCWVPSVRLPPLASPVRHELSLRRTRAAPGRRGRAKGPRRVLGIGRRQGRPPTRHLPPLAPPVPRGVVPPPPGGRAAVAVGSRRRGGDRDATAVALRRREGLPRRGLRAGHAARAATGAGGAGRRRPRPAARFPGKAERCRTPRDRRRAVAGRR